LVVFRDRFGEGVGSFSNLIGAGGVGVLAGILTVGKLEERFRKERIVAGAFLAGAAVLLVVSTHITGWSVLIASFFVGLTFAWKKIPIDTMVQESIPDGYRGRVFAVYDVAYNVSRIVAAFLAIALLPTLGAAGTVAVIGVLFLLWSPVLPLWIGRAPEIRLRFYEGAKAEEWPRAVVWGGVEERVDVRRSWVDERNGMRSRRFRLALEDGTVIDVSKTGDDGQWRLDRELSS
jgi:MFS family permease